jgi:glutamate-1-semialdehyde aminotransferase
MLVISKSGGISIRFIKCWRSQKSQRFSTHCQLQRFGKCAVCGSKYDVACILLEPILQNIGIVKPKEGYLEGLRKMADEHGFR